MAAERKDVPYRILDARTQYRLPGTERVENRLKMKVENEGEKQHRKRMGKTMLKIVIEIEEKTPGEMEVRMVPSVNGLTAAEMSLGAEMFKLLKTAKETVEQQKEDA